MGFLDVLGKVTKIGESFAPAAAINPAAGLIMNLVVNAVIKAEQGGGTGPTKKQEVIQELIPVITPLVATLIPSSGGRTSINSEGLTQAVSQIVDGVVALLNAVQAGETAAKTKP
jgi:hypothetical protein